MHHPINHIHDISKIVPNLWANIENLVKMKEKINLITPSWCFLPRLAYMDLLKVAEKAGAIEETNDDEKSQISAYFCTLIPWNYTRYIYEFDPDFFLELTKTNLTQKIPINIFEKIPVYSIYIKIPGINEDLCGFFVSFQPWYDENNKIEIIKNENNNEEKKQYTIVMNVLLDHEHQITEYDIIFDKAECTINDAVMRAVTEISKTNENFSLSEHFINNVKFILSDVLNCVLYICSQSPDIKEPIWLGEKPGNPKLEKIKGKFRLFPPKKFKIFKTGFNIGKTIREYKYHDNHFNSDKNVRPHIRRAHWHGYWKGPKKGEREYELKWLSPILVGSENNYIET